MKIELRPAYVWDCDECGTENFARALILSLGSCGPSEELREMLEEKDIDINKVSTELMPEQVTCKHCKKIYSTVHMFEIPYEED